MTLLLGLDLGTSHIKAVALNRDTGRVVALCTQPTPVTRKNDRSEHDPEELWNTCARVLRGVVAEVNPADIGALALASFGDTGVALDKHGEPLYPIMTWYDRRCTPQVEWLSQQLDAQAYHALTGQRFSTSLGLSKWLWLAQSVERVQHETATWLATPDYILWRLTGQCVTDYSIASRTGLFDQKQLDWSEPLLALSGIRRHQLPTALPGGTRVGGITAQAARQTGLLQGTPCSTGGHDHLCAMLLAGQDLEHTLVDSSGTAQSVLLTLDHFAPQAELQAAGYSCYAHVLPGRYVLRGGLRAAGGAIEWYVKRLLAVPDSELPTAYRELAQTAASRSGRQPGPLWLPHLLGSGTPHNDPSSLAAVVGMRAEYDRADLFGGLVQSLAFWLRENVDQLEQTVHTPIDSIVLLGGVTQLEWLNQVKADVLNRPVVLPLVPEPAAVGAAILAGVSVGTFATVAQGLASCTYGTRTLTPDPARHAWYDRVYRQAYLPLYDNLKMVNASLNSLSASLSINREKA